MFSYVHLDEVDQKLKCGVCSCPCVKPLITECDHMFCGGCLFDEETCPSCKEPIEADQCSSPPSLILNSLDKLAVFCAHKGSDCSWQGLRGGLSLHLDECPKEIAIREARKADAETESIILSC